MRAQHVFDGNKRTTRCRRNSSRFKPERIHNGWQTMARSHRQKYIDEPQICWSQRLAPTLSAPSREDLSCGTGKMDNRTKDMLPNRG